MNARIIAIGDIHGCHAEFSEMLDRLSPTPQDRLVLLGDLINRGPDSLRVIDLAKQNGALALLGNHELRLLEYRKTGNRNLLGETDEDTLSRLRPDDWKFLEQMPLTHSVEEAQTVFVHGGFLPGSPWSGQPASVVTRIQVIDPSGRPRKRAECENCPSWAEFWKGPPYVVYGHTPRPEIHPLKWSVGIDTACVLGGYLTAYVLPDKRFVQVKARRRYFG